MYIYYHLQLWHINFLKTHWERLVSCAKHVASSFLFKSILIIIIYHSKDVTGFCLGASIILIDYATLHTNDRYMMMYFKTIFVQLKLCVHKTRWVLNPSKTNFMFLICIKETLHEIHRYLCLKFVPCNVPTCINV